MIVARISSRLRSLVRNERGMALPTALFAMVASLGLAGAAVMSTVDVQRGSQRDNSSKSAIAAADAGVNVATLRLNRDAEELATAPCLDGATPQADGWCPPVSDEVGDAEYTYRVSQAGSVCGEFDLCAVVTGTAGEVSRRVLITFNQGPGGPGSGGNNENEGEEGEEGGSGSGGGPEGLIGRDELEIHNNADARVSVGTNGNVYVHNNGNVCGNIRHGVGKKATFENNGTQCSGYSISEGDVSLPSVSSFMPSDIATKNDNYRLAMCTKTSPTKVPTGCQSDSYSKKWKSDEPWDATKRWIQTSNNATLTLSGGDYFICKLELSNNVQMIMGEGAKVRIFFDTPENCGLSSGTKQLYVSNNASITATGYQPELGQFEMPGFYFLGSETISTKIEWKNNSGANEFVLYAPNTDIVLQNNAVFKGVIVGKTVELYNNAIVEHDDGFELPPYLNPWYEEGGESEEETEEEEEPAAAPVFTPQFYVECSGPATPTPDANC